MANKRVINIIGMVLVWIVRRWSRKLRKRQPLW